MIVNEIFLPGVVGNGKGQLLLYWLCVVHIHVMIGFSLNTNVYPVFFYNIFFLSGNIHS